jgi:hypothetical protein
MNERSPQILDAPTTSPAEARYKLEEVVRLAAIKERGRILAAKYQEALTKKQLPKEFEDIHVTDNDAVKIDQVRQILQKNNAIEAIDNNTNIVEEKPINVTEKTIALERARLEEKFLEADYAPDSLVEETVEEEFARLSQGIDIPSPETVAWFGGFNPFGSKLDPVFKKMLGWHDLSDNKNVPQVEANNEDGVKVDWDKKARLDNVIEKKWEDPIASFFDHYKTEFAAADIMGGAESSVTVFNITMNTFLTNDNLDTIMAHSTGAKVILSFLQSMACMAYGDPRDEDGNKSAELPTQLQELKLEMQKNGFNHAHFLEKIFDKVKVIQLIRGNADITDITKLHPKLIQLMSENDVKIFNYFYKDDAVLKKAETFFQLKLLAGGQIKNLDAIGNKLKLFRLKFINREKTTPEELVAVAQEKMSQLEIDNTKKTFTTVGTQDLKDCTIQLDGQTYTLDIESKAFGDPGVNGHGEAGEDPEKMRLILMDKNTYQQELAQQSASISS